LPAPVAKVGAMEVSWLSWLAWLWLAGCVLFLIRLLLGSWTVWRIVSATQPIPGRTWQQLLAECQRKLGLRGRVRLRLAGPGFVPSAAGLLRRTVLLPDEAVHWTSEQRRLVLLHELGHFRRGDLWTHALGRLACALHWFNPFAWMLHRQLAIEREFACDELVLARGAAPDDYATLLFEMATASRQRPALQAAFLTMASPRTGKLEARVRRILAPARKTGRWLRIADGALCITLAALLVICSACKPVHRIFAGPSNPWAPGEIETRLAADPFPG
jgi:beta-lactamase regulating signal transducer with metallopeptidase domain